MKKFKLLMAAPAAIAAIPCLTMGFATSCSTSSIEIKKNDNITITTGSLKKGEAFTINYQLTNGYGFDVVNSTIKFGDNQIVYLIQCTIDEGNKTITIPAANVTDSKVVVDIKTESNSTLNISEDDYNAAWKNIVEPADSRKATLDIVDASVNSDGTRDKLNHKTSVLNGKKTHSTVYQINDDGTSETKIDEYWSDKDQYVGYWDYEWMPKEDKIIKYSMSLDITDTDLLSDQRKFKGFDYLAKDELFNCYWGVNGIGTHVYEVYAKFDSNKKLSSFAFNDYKISKGEYSIGTTIAKIDYNAETITMPENAELDGELWHEIPQGQTELDITNKRGVGRYEFYAPNGTGNSLQVIFDKKITAITGDTISIWAENVGELARSDWSYANDGTTIQINAGKFTKGGKVKMTLGYPNNLVATGVNHVKIALA